LLLRTDMTNGLVVNTSDSFFLFYLLEFLLSNSYTLEKKI
jgi:hypothetical protein